MELAGQRMEAGDAILLSLLSANRDPDVYPEPLAFRPGERPVRTSPSASDRISASVRHWRGCRRPPLCRRCSTARRR
jgi:cytochrome P450